MKNKIKLSKKSIVIIMAVILIAAGGGFFIYNKHKQNSKNVGGNSGLEQPINYGPPTTEEQSAGDQQKKDIENNQNKINNDKSSSSKKSVTPIISTWGQNSQTQDIEVNGFITGIYESGGKCIATMQKDSAKVSATRLAYKDAQTTNCGLLTIPRGQLSSGNWQITLTYTSDTAQGSSKPINLNVE